MLVAVLFVFADPEKTFCELLERTQRLAEGAECNAEASKPPKGTRADHARGGCLGLDEQALIKMAPKGSPSAALLDALGPVIRQRFLFKELMVERDSCITGCVPAMQLERYVASVSKAWAAAPVCAQTDRKLCLCEDEERGAKIVERTAALLAALPFKSAKAKAKEWRAWLADKQIAFLCHGDTADLSGAD
jgi:hypothetical protein